MNLCESCTSQRPASEVKCDEVLLVLHCIFTIALLRVNHAGPATGRAAALLQGVV